MSTRPVRLDDLLADVPHSSVSGATDLEVTGCTCDSREVEPGDLFAALKGFKADGRCFAGEAAARGAVAVLAHAAPDGPPPPGVAWIVAPRDREAFSAASAAVYRTREAPCRIVGVTGTNGKTTTAYLLRSILRCAGGAGLLGTIEYDDGEGLRPAARTTPEAHHVHRWIRRLADGGVPFGVMEVSSHALALARVRDVAFAVAAFTNLTRDHLDFHHSMEAYYLVKRGIFDLLEAQGRAVVNLAGPYGDRLLRDLSGRRVWTVSTEKGADVHATHVAMDLSGIRATFATPAGEVTLESPLTGAFNLQNLLMAAASALAAGAKPAHVAEGVAALRGVPGRMEKVEAGQPFAVFVDYAHTDDALKNLLQTVRNLKPRRLITVFGCGGDRDTSKRPLMGAVAARLSDVTILTSDNPRTESPAAIARDVESGLRPELSNGKVYRLVLDRREAIGEALSMAKEGDAVVIAGKGHEREQIVGAARRPFHDPEVAMALLKEMGWR